MEKDKVVEIDKFRPHRVSQALCVNCSYTWVSVAPIDLKRYDLQCPRCMEFKASVIGLKHDEG